MIQRSQLQTNLIRTVYILFDAVLISIAFYLACLFRPDTLPFDVTVHNFFSSVNPYRSVFASWLLLVIFFNQTHGLYRTHREKLESLEIWEVIKSVLGATLIFVLLSYFFKIHDFPRSIIIISNGLLIVLLSLWRIAKKSIVDYLVSHGYNNFNAVIIGAGKVGRLLEQEIKKRPGLGVKIIGFLDDVKSPVGDHSRIIGKVDDYTEVVRNHFINIVFVTIHPDDKMLLNILELSKELNVAVRVVPQGFEWMARDVSRYNIGIVPILEYTQMYLNYLHQFKRIFDVLLTIAGTICLLPVLIILAVWIKIDSPGPVFYRSKRYGRGGQIFQMLKFRSMVVNADELLAKLKDKNEVDGPIFKMKKDPRITRSGAFLRRYSLDELPQIFNVLLGDMSLVGPRPLPIEQIEKEDLRQLKRLNIRPGITGLWQIRGRSDVSFERFLRWDIWYINNWSFGLDLYILFQTLPVVIKGKGAY